MSEACRFDDSLSRLLRVLATKLGNQQLEAGVVLRDAVGCLSFFAASDVDPAVASEIDALARTALGYYARPDRLFVGPSAPGSARVLQDPEALTVRASVDDEGFMIRYLDRRIVGVDWLRRPPSPPAAAEEPRQTKQQAALRVAFSSLKGGVGRSTALTVVAAEQARKGRNVLVVDLDLEAPGIGSLLLSEERMPRFGVLDYLVERNFGPVDRTIVNDMLGTSELTQGQGLVSVVPAAGSRTLHAPGNYFAKLSRAMIEAISDDGEPVSLAAKLHEMLNNLEALRRYDLVLIDVRAGLAELAAGPLLVLNAEVLIFGTPQRQTLQDLKFLCAHLSSLTVPAPSSPWTRLKMVHAKAVQTPSVQSFRDDLWELFTNYLYVETVELEEFNFDVDDPDAPHYPLVIPLDTAFTDWDPVSYPDRLVTSYYERTFGDLLVYVEELLTVDSADA